MRIPLITKETRKPFTEIRVRFLEPGSYDEVIISPNKLPWKVKDKDGKEYVLNKEDVLRMRGVDPELYKYNFTNLHWWVRFWSWKRIGVAYFAYGTPSPISHITYHPEYTGFTPQQFEMSVKQERYGNFLRSLTGHPLGGRRLLIIVVVIIIIGIVVYLLGTGQVKI
jgi:hypothetical protein